MLPQGKCDMSEVDKMAYYDLKTNEIWADSNIAGFHDEHIEIDEVIAPLIRESIQIPVWEKYALIFVFCYVIMATVFKAKYSF